MAHIPGHDRSQILLLPEAVDDYVGPDNPVRFLEAFVDGLDLQAAGFARELPVFWACGVTPQSVVAKAKPPLFISHHPGAMLITDLLNSQLSIL